MSIFKNFGRILSSRMGINFISLTLLELSNYALPLITLPYIFKVVGSDNFGIVSFVLAVVQYFVFLVEYGFSLSATRTVALKKNDPEFLGRFVSSVTAARLLLAMISLGALFVCCLVFPKMSQSWKLYLLAYGIVLGNALFPLWLFQGIEKMVFITTVFFSGRLVFTVLTFVYIQEKEDFILLPVLHSINYLIVGLLSIWIVQVKLRLKLNVPKMSEVIFQLKDGAQMFYSMMATNFLSSSGVFILGLFASNAEVGVFSAVEKILRSALRLLIPVSLTVYPRMNALSAESPEKAKLFNRRLLIFLTTSGLFVSALLFLFARPIVCLVVAENIDGATTLLKAFAIMPFLVFIREALGVQTMIPQGMQAIYSRITVQGLFISCILMFILAPRFHALGVSYALIAGEIIMVALIVWALRIKKT